MPAIVNYGGDEDFRLSGASFYSNLMDSSLILSLGPHVDVYCPPRKRSRISAPFVLRSPKIEEEKRSSIDVLPDECLFEIFRRLPGAQERRSCAGVSKRWLMLQSSIRRAEICSANDVVMSSPSEEAAEESESDGFLTRCLEGKKATDIRLAAIAVGTSTRGGLGLSEIANNCNMLEKLDLSMCASISDKGLLAVARSCPNLVSLTIESCPKIANEGLQAIGRCCPKLRSVSIKDCPLVGDQGVASLVSSASALTKIKLNAVNITDLSLAVIGHYGKALTDAAFTGLQCVSERGFWVMGNTLGLEELKSLAITACAGVTDRGLEALGKGCFNLRQLFLRRCSFVSDSGLKAFAQAAASLESLQLEECNRITQLGVLGALSNCGEKLRALSLVKCIGIKDTTLGSAPLSPCRSLRSLTISNCPGFGSTGLALVGKLCPQLQQLDLSGLCSATDAGFLALLEGCESGLVKVNLSGCINLTDATVLPLVRSHGSTLQVLNLEGCWRVTDESLVTIADSCSLLIELDVSRCMVTDAGVVALASAKQLDLQVLSLSGCSQVSNKSMPELRKLGRFLVGLNLQNCNLISNSAIELLGEHLWRCDILF
ncbi:EIN3-binding F-box protein 1-like protein [Cinnamomum micranthum f. kanehirae]|uniref:EIN3-binding F-box protein 1-like protein n=1 Tax=Cinnamomum micranthum f. kanehirae TaxID=337451 RepID=A0A3S3PT99_9MAGN|nr:EIN3-binding F-box protein 1-like protein [Cinnamomum micranthum f. kanehirae]